MMFASRGAVIQNGLFVGARKRMFMFDSSINIETAMTNALSWVKQMVEARSIAYNIDENKIYGCACSGIKASKFYPAELRHGVWSATVSSLLMFSLSDSLTAERRALRYGVLHPQNNTNFLGNPLAGPLALSNNSLYDTYLPKELPQSGKMKTVLLPKKYAANYGAGGFYFDVTGSYDYGGSGSSYTFTRSYFGVSANYNTELNTYSQVYVSVGQSTKGQLVRLYNTAPAAGIASIYTTEQYVYSPFSGAGSVTYSWSNVPSNPNVQSNAVINVAVPYGAPADTPDFEIEWAGCPVWNGEKISCEVFKKGIDFTNNTLQKTDTQPDISLVALPEPTYIETRTLL